MDGDPRPRDTREFVAQWNAATEAHLTSRLQQVLGEMAAKGVVPNLTQAEIERVAPMLVHALQVAAAPDGGAHAAIQHLSELTGTQQRAR
jgi:uncharacterized protein YciW